jgi:hypothetical protein
LTYATLIDEVLADLGYDHETVSAQTHQRVASYLDRATDYIANVAGSPVNFESDLLARQLVIAYCRYANSHIENLFQDNYRSDLLELNCKYAGDEDGESE